MGGSFQFVMGQFTRPGQRFVLHTSIIAAIPVHCLSWLIHRSLRRPWCKIAFKQWFNVVEKLPQPSYVYIYKYIYISVCVCGISPISPIIWDYRHYIWIHKPLTKWDAHPNIISMAIFHGCPAAAQWLAVLPLASEKKRYVRRSDEHARLQPTKL